MFFNQNVFFQKFFAQKIEAINLHLLSIIPYLATGFQNHSFSLKVLHHVAVN